MKYESSSFEQLQELLLGDTRQQTDDLYHEVSDVKAEVTDMREHLNLLKNNINEIIDNIENIEKFNAKVEPVLSLKVVELKKNFNKFFGYEVKEAVKAEVHNSKDEFIEAFYPIMGKLIRRYMRYEIEAWFDKFTSQVENTFSWQYWRDRLSGKAKLPHLVTHIEEVFIIAHGSGLLIGSYSQNNTADINMIAGMLTAVKGFMGEVFNNKGDLSTIDYAEYEILIHDHFKYYFAVVVSGMPDEHFKAKVRTILDDFAELEMPEDLNPNSIDDSVIEAVSDRLKNKFENTDFF
jgi:hypothetical protein